MLCAGAASTSDGWQRIRRAARALSDCAADDASPAGPVARAPHAAAATSISGASSAFSFSPIP